MNQKRNRLQVIYDILNAIQNKNGKIKPTHIMYKANLSHQMLEEYLGHLISNGFIHEVETKEGKSYSLADKGFHYLSKYSTILDFMETFGLE